MRGYVVSRGGTFGVVHRRYRTEAGVACVVIRSGPLGWLTAVTESDCHQLQSRYEAEARAEATAWLRKLEPPFAINQK